MWEYDQRLRVSALVEIECSLRESENRLPEKSEPCLYSKLGLGNLLCPGCINCGCLPHSAIIIGAGFSL